MKLISLNDFGVQNWIVIVFLKKLPIIIAISVSASVSADMKIFISAFYRYRPIRKRELSALYWYQPIWKKAYRSTAELLWKIVVLRQVCTYLCGLWMTFKIDWLKIETSHWVRLLPWCIKPYLVGMYLVVHQTTITILAD